MWCSKLRIQRYHHCDMGSLLPGASTCHRHGLRGWGKHLVVSRPDCLMGSVRASLQNTVIFIHTSIQPQVLCPGSRDAGYGGFKGVLLSCVVYLLSISVLASLSYLFTISQLPWDTLIGLTETFERSFLLINVETPQLANMIPIYLLHFFF